MADGLEALLQLDQETRRNRGLLHTPMEIVRQPDTWLQVARVMAGHQGELRSLLDGSREVVLTGAGSSHFLGKTVERTLRRRLGLPVTAIPSTELILDPQAALPHSPFLLVSAARSGNSPEGNTAFQLVDRLRPGLVRHVVVTCNAEGELARLARKTESRAAVCLLPPEADDQGLAMTNSFTSLLIANLALGYLDAMNTYLETVQKLSTAARVILAHAGRLEALAQLPFRRVFFIGSGALYGAALESHLKVQELTDGLVIGKAEGVLGLRHGPMAAIDPSTLVVLFASSHPYRRRYEADLLRELRVKGLGIQRVVVCGHAEPEWYQLADQVLEFDPEGHSHLDDDVSPPLYAITGQVLGLFTSLRVGLKPDSPSRHGVIHRVVQGVQIHPFEP